MSDKVVVTHEGALKRKYGPVGFNKIRAAVNALIAQDAKRGITTRYVGVDNAQAMKQFNAKPVRRASDRRAVKAGIDAIFAADNPAYLMILGAPDVVPHQRLKNPLHNPAKPLSDPDVWVPSDLPYACAAPWSEDVADFVAPSRVVGRLPDLVGAHSPAHVLGLVRLATDAKPLPATRVQPFSISAHVWQTSTRKSLSTLFGAAVPTQTSPTNGPQWTNKELGATVHFINCHGAKKRPLFYGDPGFPVAHDASWISKKIKSGTVAAVECCYGAELYDPSLAKGQQCIGQTYLECGAAAYFGSTTIAYGPAATNAYADVICRMFLEEVLKGRSSGDACLTARLRYAKQGSPIDACDLKTLGQFVLLGDPSIHPITVGKAASNAKSAVAVGVGSIASNTETFSTSGTARSTRRRKSRAQAEQLAGSVAVSSEPVAPSPDIARLLKKHLLAAGVDADAASIQSFATTIGTGPMRKSAAADPGSSVRVHIATARRLKTAASGLRGKSASEDDLDYPVAVVAREKDGKLISVETVYGKSTPKTRRPSGQAARRWWLKECSPRRDTED